jgi:hypothetical protein
VPLHRTTGRKLRKTFVWQRFDAERTKQTGGDVKCLLCHINLAVSPEPTHQDLLEAVAQALQPPLAIESLSEELSKKILPRSRVIFWSSAANVIDEIAENYPRMSWWVSKRGLNMDAVAPQREGLLLFDEFAGKLVVEATNGGKRLLKTVVISIAKQLDRAGFSIEELQPAQRDKINKYNRQYSKRPLKTFEAVAAHPPFVHAIRRRLYVARDRYIRFQSDFR